METCGGIIFTDKVRTNGRQRYLSIAGTTSPIEQLREEGKLECTQYTTLHYNWIPSSPQKGKKMCPAFSVNYCGMSSSFSGFVEWGRGGEGRGGERGREGACTLCKVAGILICH